MTDETWTDDDDAQFRMAALPPQHPVHVARVFFLGVRDGSLDPVVRDHLVTPESRPAWGDFSNARADFGAIANPAVGSLAHRSGSADDVVYVRIVPDVEEGYTEQTGGFLAGPVFTLVWRPEANLWQIHQFGEPVEPRYLPRTSPGIAPAV
ncbi:MAG: hypothetical protein AAGC61_03035 [Microbacterium sp.]